jgi:hypothetical protein
MSLKLYRGRANRQVKRAPYKILVILTVDSYRYRNDLIFICQTLSDTDLLPLLNVAKLLLDEVV